MDRLADDPFLDEPDDFRIVVVGHVLRADLHEPLVPVGRLLDLLGQLELAPVRQRLLAVDVLAGVQGVDRLRRVKAVGRGDADHVDVLVGQEGLVLHVHLRPAGRAAGGFQAGPIDIAHGHRLGNALFLEGVDDAQVRSGHGRRCR